MKIDEIYKNVNLINSTKDTPASNRSIEQNEPSAAVGDEQKSGAEVDFSKTSIEYSQALEVMDQEPADRVEKVNALRTKVEEGTYRVDSKKVANKIIEDAIFNILES